MDRGMRIHLMLVYVASTVTKWIECPLCDQEVIGHTGRVLPKTLQMALADLFFAWRSALGK